MSRCSATHAITESTKKDFQRFQTEMKDVRGIDVEWRVLSGKAPREHRDRFFISDDLSRNLPPFNTILTGSTGEILPSEVTEADFDGWFADGVDLLECEIPERGESN